jgi:hypothetical protein
MEHNNAKQFALQLGALITLFTSLGSLIVLLFSIINTLLPDLGAYDYYYSDASYSIRYSIAMLVVFFPAYLVLTRKINTYRRLGQSAYLGLTRWLIYLALLIGGLVILGDLVSVILNFLNGELTLRFILKALTILVVVGGAFSYYLLDAKEYWNSHEKYSWYAALGTALVVIVSIVSGYMLIESPREVRERTLDTETIVSLETIQSYIQSHVVVTGSLPNSLSELGDFEYLPEAPEGRAQFTYTRVADDAFELCAEFGVETDKDDISRPYTSPMVGYGQIREPFIWNHQTGLTCFTRHIDITSPRYDGMMKPEPVMPTLID